MDHRSDLLNTPSYPVPDCLRIPADATPAEAAAGIVSYFKDMEWPDRKLRKLAEYIINQCGGSAPEVKQSILESTREVVVSYFADLLKMGQTTFLTSEKVHQSFAKTLGSEADIMYLGYKLNKDQAFYIANAVLGKTSASHLEDDSFSQRGSVQEFSFRVIQRICQAKGYYYTIQEFLDQLENPVFST